MAPDRVFEAASQQPQNFTLRSLLLGLAIGVVICFSNTYFGLQTGWVSSMAMPSALIGFAWFKAVSSTLSYPFTPVENVLVQSVAGSVGTMPLGCGFVGVIPALEYLLKPDETQAEGTGVHLSLAKLIIWAVGICFFGVVFAVPLRRQVIIREKLKFPSGTATALMIGVLHGREKDATIVNEPEQDSLIAASPSELPHSDIHADDDHHDHANWKARINLLTLSFAASAMYTLMSYFVPIIRDIPFLGPYLAKEWLWTMNPSPAYIGQGIIMGPATTLHMLLGAIIGWGVLSPLAKARLGKGQQRLDRLDKSCHHVGRLNRQPRLAAITPNNTSRTILRTTGYTKYLPWNLETRPSRPDQSSHERLQPCRSQ
jgi:OPT family oligopeptide transporter